MKRLLCVIGIHDWRYQIEYDIWRDKFPGLNVKGYYPARLWRHCWQCGKIENLLYSIYDPPFEHVNCRCAMIYHNYDDKREATKVARNGIL